MAVSAPGSSGCRRIQRLSGFNSSSQDHVEAGCYDDPPLPSLLVSFKEHDAIIACFDEEGQSMMEGTAEPTVCVVFSPRMQMKFGTHSGSERFVAFNCALFQLVEEIQAWRNAMQVHLSIGENIVRAA